MSFSICDRAHDLCCRYLSDLYQIIFRTILPTSVSAITENLHAISLLPRQLFFRLTDFLGSKRGKRAIDTMELHLTLINNPARETDNEITWSWPY